MRYPEVIGEFDTMRQVSLGMSLARFGDGELKLIYGSSYVRETGSVQLATELFNVLNQPHANCLVGIPTMDASGPKIGNWLKHQKRFERVIQGTFQYYSAFVTRPDSAPWIECVDYLAILLSVWDRKRVLLISEPDSKLRKVLERTAGTLITRDCPSHGAYALIDDFEKQAMKLEPDVTIMSMGPTATCLANRLASRGLQGLDFGSAGGMIVRLCEKQGIF